MSRRFEWDKSKNQNNQQKHGISFEQAQAVFDDPNRIVQRSPRHKEARWKTVGLIFGVLFTIVYTLRHSAVRLISARRASRRESQAYHNDSSNNSVTSLNHTNHDDH